MPYLIDGNNLIGHTPDLRVQDERSKHTLLKRLLDFHRATGAKVLVVFDGESGQLVPDNLNLGGVRVTYSGRHSDADSKIKRLVEGSNNPKEFIVVSSDTAVYNFARQHRAQALKCHEFNHKLSEHLSKGAAHTAPADEKKPEVGDLDEWYKYFGINDTKKE